jgi:hypothetical protein
MWSMTTRSWIQHVDDAWFDLMEDLRWQPLVDVAKILSFLGGTICNWSIRVAVILILVWRRQWLNLTAFVLAVVASEVLIGPMKALYDRPRPPNDLGGVVPVGARGRRRGHRGRARHRAAPSGPHPLDLGAARRVLRVAHGAEPDVPRCALALGCRRRHPHRLRDSDRVPGPARRTARQGRESSPETGRP